MLVRTDPFRELDRLTQHVLGTAARPAAMPMDAYRQGDSFYVHFDLPGVSADSIELTVEQNVLTVRAERKPEQPGGGRVARPRVGVHRAGEPPVGAGDVRAGGVRADAQHLVGVRLTVDHPGLPALAPDYLSMRDD